MLGRFNKVSPNPGMNAWSPADAILRVGDGTANNKRSDALLVLKSARSYIYTPLLMSTLQN